MTTMKDSKNVGDAGASFDQSHDSATCQHRIGHYSWAPSGTDRGDVKLCGKQATHVANYPKRQPFYLCRKHGRTRCYVRELANTERSGGEAVR